MLLKHSHSAVKRSLKVFDWANISFFVSKNEFNERSTKQESMNQQNDEQIKKDEQRKNDENEILSKRISWQMK